MAPERCQRPLSPFSREKRGLGATNSRMPRPPRIVIPGLPHHITQRGNYRQQVFYRDADREIYLRLLADYSRHCGVSLEAYCLMENHVHLVAVPHAADSLARLMQRLNSEYARWIHFHRNKMGHLWQARFHSVALDREHFWATMVYVEQNPSRAGLVELPWQWRWSSARAHVGEEKRGFLDLLRWRAAHSPETWKCCLELGIREAALQDRIRQATLSGWPLGGEEFCRRLETELGVQARPRSPRKPPTPEISSMTSNTSGKASAS